MPSLLAIFWYYVSYFRYACLMNPSICSFFLVMPCEALIHLQSKTLLTGMWHHPLHSGALNPIDNEVEWRNIWDFDYTSHAFVFWYLFWLFSDCFKPFIFLSIDCYVELALRTRSCIVSLDNVVPQQQQCKRSIWRMTKLILTTDIRKAFSIEGEISLKFCIHNNGYFVLFNTRLGLYYFFLFMFFDLNFHLYSYKTCTYALIFNLKCSNAIYNWIVLVSECQVGDASLIRCTTMQRSKLGWIEP